MKTKKGGVRSARPRKVAGRSAYLVVEGVGVVPVGGGSTVGAALRVRPRKGGIPNSTSLSLRLPKCCLAMNRRMVGLVG